MTSRQLASALLPLAVALAGGCASADGGTPAPPDTVLASVAEPPGAVPPAARPSLLELSIWRDPDFKRRFAESYLAETEIEPRVTTDERDTMLEVLDLIGAEKADEAARLLEKNRDESSSAVFDFTLGNLHFQRGEFEPAAAAYQIAVDKYPKFRRAWYFLAVSTVRLGDFARALPALTRVVELGGGDGVVYGLLGLAYSNAQDHVAAESAFRMAILMDPATLDWKVNLAQTFFKARRFAEAVTLFDTLLAEHPDQADLWLLQGKAYLGLEQPLKAAENFEWVDLLGKSTAESLSTLGDIYINADLCELALNAYLRALDTDSTQGPERALRAAGALMARNAREQSGQLIERIQSVYGDRLAVDDRKNLLKLRARIAVAEGAGDEEARVLEETIALDPLDGEALILLGQYKSRSGEEAAAADYYERAASVDGFEADAKLAHGRLLVQQRRYAEALPLLRRVQVLEPRDTLAKYLQEVERLAAR